MKKMVLNMFCALCVFETGYAFPRDLWLTTLDVSVVVQDEQGNALADSHVTVYFRHTDKQEERTGESTVIFERDYNGEEPVSFQYEGLREVGFTVKKEGFWTSELGYDFTVEDRVDERDGSPNGHYRKAFTIVLRKKVNPRPLYVQRVKWLTVPGYDQSYGFDLEKGDWVAPNGEGVYSDFIFKVSGTGLPFPEYKGELKLTFSNEKDGLIEIRDDGIKQSKLFLGTKAPDEGYVDQVIWQIGLVSIGGKHVSITKPPYEVLENLDGYWFRVRSENKRPNQIRSRYGKILGPIQFEVRDGPKPLINFTYYLAPDYEPYVEWDGKSLVHGADIQGLERY
jgi:hypothetical protein